MILLTWRASSRRSATAATDTPGTASRLIRSAAHHAPSRLRTPSRLPTGADLTVAPGPRRGASRRRFPCLPTHVPLWQRPGRCDTGFSHLDCRSVLILIVALLRSATSEEQAYQGILGDVDRSPGHPLDGSPIFTRSVTLGRHSISERGLQAGLRSSPMLLRRSGRPRAAHPRGRCSSDPTVAFRRSSFELGLPAVTPASGDSSGIGPAAVFVAGGSQRRRRRLPKRLITTHLDESVHVPSAISRPWQTRVISLRFVDCFAL